MKRRITLLIAVAALLVFTAGAIAGSSSEKIQAYLAHDIKIVVNDADFQATDGDANLSPIIYNDRTYLPVRSIGEALGVEVDWDNDTRTVYLGERTVKEPVDKDEEPADVDPVDKDEEPAAPVAELAIDPVGVDLNKNALQDIVIDVTWGSANEIIEIKGLAKTPIGDVKVDPKEGSEYIVSDNGDGTATLTIDSNKLAAQLPVSITMVPDGTELSLTITFDDGQKTFDIKVVS